MKRPGAPFPNERSLTGAVPLDKWLKFSSPRKHVDVSFVHEMFRSFAGTSDKVYIICNDKSLCGFNILLGDIVRHFAVKELRKEDDRNPADAVREAAIMLHPDNHVPVTASLRGTKNTRAESDQTVSPCVAWAMDAMEHFKDPTIQVLIANDVNPEDIDGI
jgi:hypothetical protein